MAERATGRECPLVPLRITKSLLKRHGLKALLVRATDRYFNEYVPRSMSMRTMLTGFDGSAGDALITDETSHLFIDGRYALQAKIQSADFIIHVVKPGQSIEDLWLGRLNELLPPGTAMAYDPNTVDLRLYERMASIVEKGDARLLPIGRQLLEEIAVKKDGGPISKDIFRIGLEVAGSGVKEKLEQITALVSDANADAILLTKLDDIAWITNLRSYLFPHQSSIPGIACTLSDRVIIGLADGLLMPPDLDPHIQAVKEGDFFRVLKDAAGSMRIAIDPMTTSKAHEMALQSSGFAVQCLTNPIPAIKAIKNEKELLHLRSAFKKADQVVYQTQSFVIDSLEKGKSIKESDVDDHIKEGFKRAGFQELSFRPICASGKNGAIIHYGTPDHKKEIEKSSLFLLDTGGYSSAGYATDLTRTFLAAPKSDRASSWQRNMFTLVLKASIRGLCARVRRGTLGMQLDTMVRAPLWQAGVDFAHGTGHGIGINVHEFPPRIGPGSATPLAEGQVFSIEPGLYFENLGGVRIENLATLVADPKNGDFLRVLPLTFCPLDKRLIDEDMLDRQERKFLDYYEAQWVEGVDWPALPPLSEIDFGAA